MILLYAFVNESGKEHGFATVRRLDMVDVFKVVVGGCRWF